MTGWVRAEDPSAVGAVRRKAVELAEAAGFDQVLIGQTAVAVSEAVSNLVKHATEGTVMVRPHPEAPATVELITVDRGPGMADVARALRDGYSTSGTLGIGLGAISRIASGYDVHSLPGKGTVLAMHFTAGRTPAPALRASGLTRPIGEETVCGDGFAIAELGSSTIVLVCDGLGHGHIAAQAAQRAVELFFDVRDQEPVTIVQRLHAGMNHTRGGAVAVARVEPDQVLFAGLGNVSGWVAHAEGRQGMVSVPGIAGHQGGRLRQYTYDLPRYAAVVLHTDGLTDRWDPTLLPGLFSRTPAVIAAGLMREAGSRRDDACVVTVRPGREAEGEGGRSGQGQEGARVGQQQENAKPGEGVRFGSPYGSLRLSPPNGSARLSPPPAPRGLERSAPPQKSPLDESTPRESTPRESTPRKSALHESTPRKSALHEDAPQVSAPRENTPHVSTPHESTPHESTQHQGTPHESTRSRHGDR
ncbi:ATP-binding SpoIIE family protein phosphatase [Nonomuraea sp. PA05]|uniref:ATP-binding SpoIIE family protein phosphatase n=1 Tax=Nonomuraea sp. PA05 TaxID=2604466 RepID=UPI001CA33397|nr:ATP-binding SpoIIE family protein phosphatase [Nonomuraea sp. PA05]